MRLTPFLLLTVVITTYVDAALAQSSSKSINIYRCGVDGRDLRDSPCPALTAGSAAALVFDQPSAGQSQSSKELAAADRKRADALEKERLKNEAEANRRNKAAVGIDGLKPIGPVTTSASSPKATLAPHEATPPKTPKNPKAPKAPKPPKPPTSSKSPKSGAEGG